MKEPIEFCPFTKSVTLPAFVNLVFCARFMERDSIAMLSGSDARYFCEILFESVEWLNYFPFTEGIHIWHGFNGGEKKIGKFRVDGYCEETITGFKYNGCLFHGCSTCFDEESAFAKNQKKASISREKKIFLQGNLGM